MDILALNCGSSSVKYQLFNWDKKEVIAKGVVERVTIGDSFIAHEVPGRDTYKEQSECPDHRVAIDLIIRTLTHPAHGVVKQMSEISAVGHRVVHGGEKFTCSVRINDEVLDAIRSVQHLAPLHNPPNISGIEAAQAVLPTVPHIAIFDTAFHQSMPLTRIPTHCLTSGMKSTACAAMDSTAPAISTCRNGRQSISANRWKSATSSRCISAMVFPIQPSRAAVPWIPVWA